MRIAFVSNLPARLETGGFPGMSLAMMKALRSYCELEYVGPINPKPRLGEHIVSKVKRLAGFKGAFFFFSEARLREIAEETEKRLRKVSYDLCFFHGFTPWIGFHSSKPYLCWSDCTFSQYMCLFHDQSQFCQEDLQRIRKSEAEWLKAARRVLFRNRWAAEGAISEYGLERHKVGYVGNYGLIEPPGADSFDNAQEFLFASTNFQLKGGPIVVKAFAHLRRKYPGIGLTIIGDRPQGAAGSMDGISYVGLLRKEVPEERAKLSTILAKARALVHPTNADTNPMILIEAGYFGCPSISTNICGIPEIVEDGVTGILLDAPPSVHSVSDAMERMIIDDQAYRVMRQTARARILKFFSTEAFESRVRIQFEEALLDDPSRRRSLRRLDDNRQQPSMRIAFVSNLPVRLETGGFSAMNVAMIEALRRFARVRYIGPINPTPSRLAHLQSKLLRTLGGSGHFFFFSPARLRKISRCILDRLQEEQCDLVLYHGFTPWIRVPGDGPYIAWSDCTFKDYLLVYHQSQNFDAADLRRIEEAEALWLQKASRVLFTSRWAAERATKHYSLDPEKVGVVGIFGALQPPATDTYGGGYEFAFISTNFKAKGGPTVAEALRRVRATHPAVQLIIIGDQPPKSVLNQDGIFYAGFLRKEAPGNKEKLRDILARIRGIVHPTSADIAPLSLVEAAYFGCPSISSRISAIPEIVEDGKTGILLDAPPSSDSVATAMERLLDDEKEYQLIRRAAREKMCREFSEAAFQSRVRVNVLEAMGLNKASSDDYSSCR
jgi:glycosyltransferase involved in cell wall biosynthesis